ncbi:hypothetical protein K432DRAFT_393427 [Lepidopterella palustris CBS 459.81]|uniref:Uncharacterized protein n=1 Tax=Lepidopterella palustris CBS 459.81 TaxID=1314670 RepID=A0A8E2JF15_9PEZI|nr:hypothetical protein K432DRAFT_393427 [Lepidopterella palustris CBS 459.81]
MGQRKPFNELRPINQRRRLSLIAQIEANKVNLAELTSESILPRRSTSNGTSSDEPESDPQEWSAGLLQSLVMVSATIPTIAIAKTCLLEAVEARREREGKAARNSYLLPDDCVKAIEIYGRHCDQTISLVHGNMESTPRPMSEPECLKSIHPIESKSMNTRKLNKAQGLQIHASAEGTKHIAVHPTADASIDVSLQETNLQPPENPFITCLAPTPSPRPTVDNTLREANPQTPTTPKAASAPSITPNPVSGEKIAQRQDASSVPLKRKFKDESASVPAIKSVHSLSKRVKYTRTQQNNARADTQSDETLLRLQLKAALADAEALKAEARAAKIKIKLAQMAHSRMM